LSRFIKLSLSSQIPPELTKLQHKPSHVRFYRDYSIADFSFCAFFTAVATYFAFLSPARAGVCEEFSHHPELMRNMLEMGLSLENCELWLERAVFAGLAFMFVIMVIRVSSITSSFLLCIYSPRFSCISSSQSQIITLISQGTIIITNPDCLALQHFARHHRHIP